MKKKVDVSELLAYAIDGKVESLPENIRNAIETDDQVRQTWQQYCQWASLLRSEELNQPEPSFYDQLIDTAVREARRAELTESTRRDLLLDSSGVFQRWFGTLFAPRWVPAMAAVFCVFIPACYFIQMQLNRVGEFHYVSGNVIVQTPTLLDAKSEDPIAKGTMIQTAREAETILSMEDGTEILVASMSRVVIEDARSIRVELGEAYFDIPKGNREFYVHTPEGSVRVLGTAFAVYVKRDESIVTVTDGVVLASNYSGGVHVQKGFEGIIGQVDQKPVARKAERMRHTVQWITSLRLKRDKEEIRKYYPSLASPSKTKVAER